MVVTDGPTPTVNRRGEAAFFELWNTNAMPARSPRRAVRADRPRGGDFPEGNGTIVRVTTFPPGRRSPMHRTETIDYGIVLEGEVYLVLDDSETALHPGDVVIQRGTDHAWENRGDESARMVLSSSTASSTMP